MSCWAILDLSADADERAIRRRYAQLLKVHRPDEDPQAFQRLREAYEDALEIVRWREEHEHDGSDAEEEDDYSTQGFRLQTVLEPASEDADMDLALAPVESLLPEHWFASADPAALQAVLEEAEAEGRREVFERGLLEHCLNGSSQAELMSRWALHRLHWFELGQRSDLPLPALEALARRLIDAAIAELGNDLRAGRERMFVECLKMLLASAWLHAFDHRELFQRRLAGLLLETPRWSDALFGAVCDLCGWDETSFSEAWQWQELVRRAEESALELRLQGFFALSSPRNAEQKAAWLVLKPASDQARDCMAEGLRPEEREACGWLADTLRYRYPLLLIEFGSPDINVWRKAASYHWGRQVAEARINEPVVPRTESAWRYTGWTAWLFLFLGLAFKALFHETSLLDLYGLPGDTALSLATAAVLAFLYQQLGRLLLHWWGQLVAPLEKLEAWLTRTLLPRRWAEQGMGVLTHLAPCAGLAALFGYWLRASALGAVPVACLAFALCGGYCMWVLRGVSPERQVARLLRPSVNVILGAFVVLAILGGVRIMSEIPQAKPSIPVGACEDEPCQRFGEVRQALLDVARAKRAAEEARAAESSSP